VSDTVSEDFWQPGLSDWEDLKQKAGTRRVYAEIYRIPHTGISQRSVKVAFSFSEDSVGAPILYREIPLPFVYAEQQPDSMAYKLVNVGSENSPHTVMKKFMVCGNCHSSSDDGAVIGLDFDAAHRDKGGYFITDLRDTMVFDTSNYFSWNKIQDSQSFGMFSKLSPCGRYVATTIKDRVVSHHFGYDTERIAFSQIFFPITGVIAIYDRYTGDIWELPGANLPEYVQTNSFWTPDGKNIVFVRARALSELGDPNDMLVRDPLVIEDFVSRRREYKFDIYIVPFNEGKGGEARPVKGASHNGMSNYFPAVSPDGKWLIFCMADNFMLLQPDSKLYIVPLEGGKSRELRSNLPLFNSWHAWSPNSKWTVFVSKGLSIYTDMFLTHIDEKGRASIPVLLENARKAKRVANYPEFVNVPADYTFNMVYKYVDIAHIRRAQIAGDKELAEKLYKQFIEQGQYKLASEYLFLAKYNLEKKNYDKAVEFIRIAKEKDPEDDEIRGIYQMLGLEIQHNN
jgi:tetratricopeptide (TPR) repeat protein